MAMLGKPIDRVSKHFGQVSKKTYDTFGISKAMIDRAIEGDEKTLEQFAKIGKLGERISLLSPALQNRIQQHIQGTVDYNTILTNMYTQGKAGVETIRGQQYQGLMSDQQLGNKLAELQQKYKIDRKTEQIRHQQTNDLMLLAAWVQRNISDTDYQFNRERQTVRVEVKQMQTDEQYQIDKSKHLLEHGTRKGLPPRREYLMSDFGGFVQGIVGKAKQLLS